MKIRKKMRYEWFFLKNYIVRLSDAEFDELITARNHYKLNHANKNQQDLCKKLLQQFAERGYVVDFEGETVTFKQDI